MAINLHVCLSMVSVHHTQLQFHFRPNIFHESQLWFGTLAPKRNLGDRWPHDTKLWGFEILSHGIRGRKAPKLLFLSISHENCASIRVPQLRCVIQDIEDSMWVNNSYTRKEDGLSPCQASQDLNTSKDSPKVGKWGRGHLLMRWGIEKGRWQLWEGSSKRGQWQEILEVEAQG